MTSAANGSPIRAAEVRVREADGRTNRLVTTDDDGRFEVRDLTPGEWAVRASKAGFVSQQYGQNHPLEATTPIKLSNGQRFTADITLIRGSAIAGHVTDEFGDPLAGVRVQAVRARMIGGRRQLTATGPADQTDDLGAYRVFGLVPGDYYVSAVLRAPENMARGSVGGVPTYYPGTRSVRDAQRVTVRASEDQTGIDISAPRPAVGVQVSGTVFTSNGAPAAGASIHLYNEDDVTLVSGVKGMYATADLSGRFTAITVMPGSYLVEASTHLSNIAGLERVLVPLEVGTTDLTGVAIATRPAASLNGTVVADAGSTLPQTLDIGISAQSVDGGGSVLNTGMMQIGNRFSLPTLSGRYVLSITDLPDGWMVKAIEIGGENMADAVVDFTNLGPTVNARIVLTDRIGEVSGVVTSRGQPRRSSVLLFPADPAKWTYPSRYVRMGRTDEEGRFLVAGLPEQRYRAVALAYIEEDAFQDTEFLARVSKAAIEFSLGEGEKKTLRITQRGVIRKNRFASRRPPRAQQAP